MKRSTGIPIQSPPLSHQGLRFKGLNSHACFSFRSPFSRGSSNTEAPQDTVGWRRGTDPTNVGFTGTSTEARGVPTNRKRTNGVFPDEACGNVLKAAAEGSEARGVQAEEQILSHVAVSSSVCKCVGNTTTEHVNKPSLSLSFSHFHPVQSISFPFTQSDLSVFRHRACRSR